MIAGSEARRKDSHSHDVLRVSKRCLDTGIVDAISAAAGLHPLDEVVWEDGRARSETGWYRHNADGTVRYHAPSAADVWHHAGD
jgi:hypothetical protein